nr:MAG TPA: DNA polymerase III subunit alpha [Caudoviricetes sp.]
MGSYDTITVIDFETASSAYYSACAIGIALIKGKELVEKQGFLIQPPDNYYDQENIAIHGITPEKTQQAPTFPVIWEKISHLFQNTYVAAHNANFDMSVLKATLNYYDLEQPDFQYIDTLGFSGYHIPHGTNIGKSLEARCEYYDIPLLYHHNAVCDAEAAAKLMITVLERSRYKSFLTFITDKYLREYSEVILKKTFGISKYRKIDINAIAATTEEEEVKDDDFNGKTFVFTGEFKKMVREQAVAIVIANGGIVKPGVSSKVDFLINAGNINSSKQEKALALQQQGHRIKILTEEQFMQMLESKDAITI